MAELDQQQSPHFSETENAYQNAIRAYELDACEENRLLKQTLEKQVFQERYEKLAQRMTHLKTKLSVYQEAKEKVINRTSSFKITDFKQRVRDLHKEAKRFADDILEFKRQCNELRLN